MLLIIRKPATPEEIAEITKDYDGYIKVVVDIERGIIQKLFLSSP